MQFVRQNDSLRELKVQFEAVDSQVDHYMSLCPLL